MDLVLIALGESARDLLLDPAWAPWLQDGHKMARIGIGTEPPPGGPERFGEMPASDIHWLESDAPAGVAAVTFLAAGRLADARQQGRLRHELEILRSCEPLAACLEPGKLYSLTTDLLLEHLGCRRGLALFSPSPAPQSPGVAARGFDEETREQLTRQVVEEKAIEAAMGQGEVAVVPWGPLHHVLGRIGIEAPGSLLSVPLRGDETERGHVWILAEGRRFGEQDLAAARTIAERASAALSTAERYHHAKERAFIDDVTGVYNARYLLATADNEIQRAARYGNPLSVLFLDLDRFKNVNDLYGHLVGSETLRALSGLLGQCVRQVDTLARYGGDEFTILLVDTPHETALRIAERIRKRVAEHAFEAGRTGQHHLTISIGVSTCPRHGEDRESILDAADKAMYRAKSQGRDRVCSADEVAGDSFG